MRQTTRLETEPYEILRELGEGSTATVYLARTQEDRDSLVALKVFKPRGADIWGEAALSSFLDKNQALQDVSSSHVVRFHQLFVVAGRPALAMEYCPGGSLLGRIGDRPLTVHELRNLLIQVLRGLVDIHDSDIVHHGIKPVNIFLDNGGNFKIGDFGLATRLARATTWEPGVAPFMAPEYQTYPSGIDGRVDLYALGMTAYHAFLGEKQFLKQFAFLDVAIPDLNWIAWARDSQQRAVPLSEIRPEIPGDLSSVIDRLIEKDRSVRYASATEALADLRTPIDVARQKPLTREGSRDFPSTILILPIIGLLIVAAIAFAEYDRRRSGRGAEGSGEEKYSVDLPIDRPLSTQLEEAPRANPPLNPPPKPLPIPLPIPPSIVPPRPPVEKMPSIMEIFINLQRHSDQQINLVHSGSSGFSVGSPHFERLILLAVKPDNSILVLFPTAESEGCGVPVSRHVRVQVRQDCTAEPLNSGTGLIVLAYNLEGPVGRIEYLFYGSSIWGRHLVTPPCRFDGVAGASGSPSLKFARELASVLRTSPAGWHVRTHYFKV